MRSISAEHDHADDGTDISLEGSEPLNAAQFVEGYRVIDVTQLLVDVDDVLWRCEKLRAAAPFHAGEFGKWQSLKAVIDYYVVRQTAIIGIIPGKLLQELPPELAAAMYDVVPAATRRYAGEVLLRVAQSASCPFLSNRKFIGASTELGQVRFTFSARGKFYPLTDVDTLASRADSRPRSLQKLIHRGADSSCAGASVDLEQDIATGPIDIVDRPVRGARAGTVTRSHVPATSWIHSTSVSIAPLPEVAVASDALAVNIASPDPTPPKLSPPNPKPKLKRKPKRRDEGGVDASASCRDEPRRRQGSRRVRTVTKAPAATAVHLEAPAAVPRSCSAPPLEEFAIASDGSLDDVGEDAMGGNGGGDRGVEGAEDEASANIEWQWFGGKCWRREPTGKLLAADGSAVSPHLGQQSPAPSTTLVMGLQRSVVPATSGGSGGAGDDLCGNIGVCGSGGDDDGCFARPEESAEEFCVPYLGESGGEHDGVLDLLDQMYDQLEKLGMKVDGCVPWLRVVSVSAGTTAVAEGLAETAAANESDVLFWCLLRLRIEGPLAALRSLRGGLTKIVVRRRSESPAVLLQFQRRLVGMVSNTKHGGSGAHDRRPRLGYPSVFSWPPTSCTVDPSGFSGGNGDREEDAQQEQKQDEYTGEDKERWDRAVWDSMGEEEEEEEWGEASQKEDGPRREFVYTFGAANEHKAEHEAGINGRIPCSIDSAGAADGCVRTSPYEGRGLYCDTKWISSEAPQLRGIADGAGFAFTVGKRPLAPSSTSASSGPLPPPVSAASSAGPLPSRGAAAAATSASSMLPRSTARVTTDAGMT
eukprot:TRINITY_DN19513_c0_g1_i1.p1 TRINITY_DN19513_c0_g1~~TRINITY_DN19513_c0_g1_i1.p1  ORF type:complete len:815 (+),score=131.17 TRINITY_DN19513_c0_g1_i1:369-2813(+)